MSNDPVRVTFQPDGTLRLEGRDGQWEPLCSACRKPIQWVLDMFSFSTFPYTLQHARCAWKPEAFDRQRVLAEQLQAVPSAAPEGSGNAQN